MICGTKLSHLLCIIYAGGFVDEYIYSDDVLEFDAENGVWKKIGSMSSKRGSHAVSVINYGAIKAYCN